MRSLIILFVSIILKFSCASGEGHDFKTKRADSLVSLETVVQQQASIIQLMQEKLNTLEAQVEAQQGLLNSQAEKITALEESQLGSAHRTSCPSGWTHHGSSCYGLGDEAQTWGDSAEICERFGGTLAIVESSDENEFIRGIGRSHGYTGIWLGGTDILTEADWVWVNGTQLTPFSSGFTDWYPGQPESGSGSGQDCLVAWKGHDSYRWGDLACHERMQFLCEIRLTN